MQNFGKIKNAFNDLLAEGLVSKNSNGKDLFKKYVKTIKEDAMMKTQFLVFSNLEEKVETNREKATEYVKESIGLFSSFNKAKLVETNKKLINIIESIEEVDYPEKELHENISKLIFTKKSPNTIDTIVEATSFIVDYIMNNTVKEVAEAIELPNSMISTILVDNYNEKYADLNESEKDLLKELLGSDDVKKKEIYSATLRECIDLINEKLGGSDVETKDKLLRVKDKLLNDKQEVNEDYIKNIIKLVDLKDSLK